MSNVNSNGAIGTASPTAVVTITAVAGDLLVLLIGNDSGVTVQKVEDDKGNIWTRRNGILFNVGTRNLEAWDMIGCAGGTTTITVTFTGSCNSTISVQEWNDKNVRFDKTAVDKSPDNTPQATLDSGVISTPTTQSVELLIGLAVTVAVTGQPDSQFTAGAGFNRTGAAGPASHPGNALEDRYVGVIGSYNATWSLTPSQEGACCLLTYRIADPPMIGGAW